MKNRYLLLSLLVVVAALGATLALYGRLPDRIPMHWNAHGEVNRYGGRAEIFMMPAVMAALLGLFAVLPRVSPRRFEVDNFRSTWWFCALAAVATLGYIQCLTLLAVLGQGIDMPRALMGGLGVFFALIGNVMGKVKRNFWIGVRTPWTLADDRVWYSTHRLAGKSMVGGGVLAFVAAMAGYPDVATWLLIAGALVPAAWSLVYYKKLERGGGLGA
jgi:uncharacterized membrane protein